MKRIFAAFLAFPIMLLGLSVVGLAFGAIGEAVELVARGGEPPLPGWLRILMAGLVGLVAGVGIARQLQLALAAAQRLGIRFPRARQAVADSIAAVLMLGLIVGISFLALALLPRFAAQRVALLVSGLLLSFGSGFVLFSRHRRPQPPPIPPPANAAATREVRRAAG